MDIHILINGTDINDYGLIALDGTLNAFMSPIERKPLVKNENNAIHGTTYIAAGNRKIKERNVNIPFYLKADNLIEESSKISHIEDILVSGINGTGINEVYVKELDATYYLHYNKMTNFSNFGIDGCCFLNINFIEPNPNNR